MIFKDYLNQECPKRQFNVSVSKEDIVAIWNVFNGNREVGLQINDQYLTYHIPKGSRHMYSMDGDGNPTNISCFKYID